MDDMSVIYNKTVVAAPDTHEREQPIAVFVTKEVNGYAVWLSEFAVGNLLLKFEQYGRDSAIEYAVMQGQKTWDELRAEFVG